MLRSTSRVLQCSVFVLFVLIVVWLVSADVVYTTIILPSTHKTEKLVTVGLTQTFESPTVERFLSTKPYIFEEGCLEALSASRANAPFELPYTLGEVDDGVPAHINSSYFNVPPDGSFMNTVVVIIDSLSRAQVMAYLPKVRETFLELLKSGDYDTEDHEKVLFPFTNALALDGTTAYHFSALLSGMEVNSKSRKRSWIHDELKAKGHEFRYLGRAYPIACRLPFLFPDEFMRMFPGGQIKNPKEKPYKCGFADNITPTYQDALHLLKRLELCNISSLCREGSTSDLSYQVEGLRQFWRESFNSSKLAILHLMASHAPHRPESIALYDDDLSSFLQSLIKSRNMNIIVATDHGRLDNEDSFPFPLMSVILCHKALNQERAANMLHNTERIVSMYDLHHTLRHLTMGDQGLESVEGVPQEFARSMMATKIARNRTCNSAGIPPSACPCLARTWKVLTSEREIEVRPKLETLLRSKQQSGCADFDIKRIDILSPELPAKAVTRWGRVKADGFIRAYIYVQENVTFHVRAYVMTPLQVHIFKQTTPYQKFEHCTPDGSDAEFCICS